MAMSQPPILNSGPARSTMSLIDSSDESCPLCDQPILHDRFDEINARIEARQSALTAEITSRLQEQFAREKADALEQARREATDELTEQIASAREEERRAAEAAANEKLAEAARISQEAQAAMQARIEKAEAAKVAAEKFGNALKAQLDQARRDGEDAIQKVKERFVRMRASGQKPRSRRKSQVWRAPDSSPKRNCRRASRKPKMRNLQQCNSPRFSKRSSSRSASIANEKLKKCIRMLNQK